MIDLLQATGLIFTLLVFFTGIGAIMAVARIAGENWEAARQCRKIEALTDIISAPGFEFRDDHQLRCYLGAVSAQDYDAASAILEQPHG